MGRFFSEQLRENDNLIFMSFSYVHTSIGSGALSSFLTVRALRCEWIEILMSYDLPQSLHLMVRRAENRIRKLMMLKPRRNYQDGIESFMLGKRTIARCEMR